MKNFPHPLVVTTSAKGAVVLAFEHEGFEIHDPFTSSCGRGPVSTTIYGLTHEQAGQLVALNMALAKAMSAQAIELAPAPPQPSRAEWALSVVAGYEGSYQAFATERQAALATGAGKGLAATAGKLATITTSHPYTALTTATPLREGRVLVRGVGGLTSPTNLDDVVLRISVENNDGDELSVTRVAGREGLCLWYQTNVGYRPDEDEPEITTEALLALVMDLCYIYETGDDSGRGPVPANPV